LWVDCFVFAVSSLALPRDSSSLRFAWVRVTSTIVDASRRYLGALFSRNDTGTPRFEGEVDGLNRACAGEDAVDGTVTGGGDGVDAGGGAGDDKLSSMAIIAS
jgi:hypothetical protein